MVSVVCFARFWLGGIPGSSQGEEMALGMARRTARRVCGQEVDEILHSKSEAVTVFRRSIRVDWWMKCVVGGKAGPIFAGDEGGNSRR